MVRKRSASREAVSDTYVLDADKVREFAEEQAADFIADHIGETLPEGVDPSDVEVEVVEADEPVAEQPKVFEKNNSEPSADRPVAGMSLGKWSGRPIWKCDHCDFNTFSTEQADVHAATAHPRLKS